MAFDIIDDPPSTYHAKASLAPVAAGVVISSNYGNEIIQAVKALSAFLHGEETATAVAIVKDGNGSALSVSKTAGTGYAAVITTDQAGGGVDVADTGTGTAVNIAKGANGAALVIAKPSGTGNAVGVTGTIAASPLLSMTQSGGGGLASIVDSGTASPSVLIDKNGAGTALSVDAVGGTGLAIQAQGGGARGDINLVPRAGIPSAPDEGDIWRVNTGTLRLRHYSGSAVATILETANTPQIRGNSGSNSPASTSGTGSPGASAYTQTTQVYPSGEVVMILWGATYSIGTVGASIVFTLYDFTASATIETITITPPTADTTGHTGSFFRCVAYTIPSGASRILRVNFTRSGGSGTVYCANGTIVVLSSLFQAVI